MPFGFERGGIERARAKLASRRALHFCRALAGCIVSHGKFAARRHRFGDAEHIDLPAISLAALELERRTQRVLLGRRLVQDAIVRSVDDEAIAFGTAYAPPFELWRALEDFDLVRANHRECRSYVAHHDRGLLQAPPLVAGKPAAN